VVDDGSEIDLSHTVGLFKESIDIQYFKKSNSGAGLSRNFGAKNAKNDWLVFLDSDVIVKKDYIENLKNNISKIPCDAFGGADKAHRSFNILQKAVSYAMTSPLTTGGIRGNKKSVSKFQPRSFNMGVKKSAFLDTGGFSEMRIGEDPDLSMRLWECGYRTVFFDDIAVYHKRRTDLGKFSNQVYHFGIARPILNLRHPEFSKVTFWFPSCFLAGYLIGVFHYFVWKFPFMLDLYGLYTFLIFFHALFKTKNLSVAAIAVLAVYVQMFSYGWGFLESWFKLNILKKSPRETFPKHFY